MARERGNLGGALRSGALLDQLVVKIDVDLSGFRRGIAEAIAQIRTLRGAIAGQVGGASLGDAMTAALVAPMAVATARIGQMRNELRLLTNEMRNVALLTAGAAGGGALVPYAGGGALIDARRRTGADGRPIPARVSGGRMARAYDIEADDLSGAARGQFDGPIIAPVGMGGGGGGDDDDDRRSRGRRGRRTPGWFFAFERGRRRFPGYDSAVDNLGGSAHGVGRGMRGAAGSNIARTLGLVGLGSLFGSLISLAGNLATVIGGTLAGAFAALVTPVGAVVALITTLVGLFVAANWDQFVEFGEWFATRWKDVIEGEGWGDLVAGVNSLKAAFSELWEVVKVAFHDDSNSIGAVLRFFGETVIRVINAVMELLGGLMRALAELVRMVAALIRGDWAAAWEAFGNIVGTAFRTVLDTIASLFPEIQSTVDGIATWVTERFQTMGEAVSNFWNQLRGNGREAYHPSQGRGNKAGRLGKAGFTGGDASNDNGAFGEGGLGLTVPMDDALERSARMADGFGQALTRALDAGARGGMKFKDVLRQLLADIVMMTAQIALLEPLSRQWGDALSGIFSGGGGSKGGKGSGSGGFLGAIMQGIGSLFGGFFADGGFLKPGQWGIVGERGPEIVFGGRSGMSIHANDNGGARIDARAFIDARGADPAAIARLEIALARRDRELPSRIRAEMGEVRQRRGHIW